MIALSLARPYSRRTLHKQFVRGGSRVCCDEVGEAFGTWLGGGIAWDVLATGGGSGNGGEWDMARW